MNFKALFKTKGFFCAYVSVQVIAIDQDEPSYRTTATVTINIKDTNDNSPEFPQDTYKLKVDECAPDGTIVANITVSSDLFLTQFEHKETFE